MYPFNGFIQSKVHNTRDIEMLDKASGTVITANQVLAKTTGGVVIPATSSTVRSEIEGIANDNIAAADAETQVSAIQIFEGDTFIADTLNNSNAAHNYQRMVLSDSLTVNNTGTDNPDGVVEQVEPYGPAANKKAIFKFV